MATPHSNDPVTWLSLHRREVLGAVAAAICGAVTTTARH
jgi:hypothetical protein